MSKLFRQASRLNKSKYTFNFSLTIQSLRLHPLYKQDDVTVTLSRGSKQTSTKEPRKPSGTWTDTLSMVVSLYRDKHGRYETKKYALVVKQAKTGKIVATFHLDASNFATLSAGTREVCELQSANPKQDATIKVEVSCTFLRQMETQGSEVSSMISSALEEGECVCVCVCERMYVCVYR